MLPRSTAPRMSLRQTVLVVALAGLASCEVVRNPGVALSTSPPGARVAVDGRDSGYLTPCVLELDRDDHQLDFELAGYRPESRLVTPGGEIYVILWQEMFLNWQVWRFPLWLNYVDGLGPIKVDRGSSPGRIFVRLRRAEVG